MRIGYFNGQLGNQTFQYIFSRFVEIVSGEPMFLDDSFFFRSDVKGERERMKDYVFFYNGYELERVYHNIKKPKLLSEAFDPDVWKFMVDESKKGTTIPQQLRNSGTDIFVIAETDPGKFDGNLIFFETNKYHPLIATAQGNIYYHGYWINKNWFNEIKQTIKPELELPRFEDEKNCMYAEQITNTKSVGIHYRRGDFLHLKWVLPESFYLQSIRTVMQKIPDATYFMFSDEIEWCKANESKLGLDLIKKNLVYVEGNHDYTNNYVDMKLMSLCKNFIMSNSSFCYLACLLNDNSDMLIMNPTIREV